MKTRALPLILLLLTAAAPLLAQLGGRDPLSPLETDQLREVAQEPDKRLKLLVKYLRARMDLIDQLRAASKSASGSQMHDRLEDFGKILDEMDDNIDDYAGRRADMRKPLREVIDAETEFQTKLKAISDAAADARNNSQSYAFVLQNDLEALATSLDSNRKLLDQQEADFKAAKEAEKQRNKKK